MSKLQIALWLLLVSIVFVICAISCIVPACPEVCRVESYKVASFYGKDPVKEHLNKHTANGEVFNPEAMTCAMWGVPFGTRFKVTNISNNKSVILRVNDRGPARRLNRAIDLSYCAFKKISDERAGLIYVTLEELPAENEYMKEYLKEIL